MAVPAAVDGSERSQYHPRAPFLSADTAEQDAKQTDQALRETTTRDIGDNEW
jgi:hypothetical protein